MPWGLVPTITFRAARGSTEEEDQQLKELQQQQEDAAIESAIRNRLMSKDFLTLTYVEGLPDVADADEGPNMKAVPIANRPASSTAQADKREVPAVVAKSEAANRKQMALLPPPPVRDVPGRPLPPPPVFDVPGRPPLRPGPPPRKITSGHCTSPSPMHLSRTDTLERGTSLLPTHPTSRRCNGSGRYSRHRKCPACEGAREAGQTN